MNKEDEEDINEEEINEEGINEEGINEEEINEEEITEEENKEEDKEDDEDEKEELDDETKDEFKEEKIEEESNITSECIFNNMEDMIDFTFPTEDIRIIELKGKDRISKPYLYHYEEVKIISERSKQLLMGMPSLIKEENDVEKIAKEELRLKILPYKIKRIIPGNIVEYWRIDELELFPN